MIVERLIELGRGKINTLPVLARNSKLMEEVGEFSEALLHKLGFLPHKKMKEPLIGEAADMIICILDTLSAACPENTPKELALELQVQLALKSEKWTDVMLLRYSEELKAKRQALKNI